MRIVQITPGAGGIYCGVCMRDNALAGVLRKMGHYVVLVPLYLPFTLDEEDQSAGTPIFFSGINVYLDQKSSFFRSAPDWLRRLLSSRGLLKWIGGKAAGTRPEGLGDLTLSMLRGEEGYQARELDELILWLKTQAKPDAISLSTALLIGLGRRIRSELKAPILCMFQGEEGFLDALPKPYSEQCWAELANRAKEADLLAAPSRYFAELMERRLSLPAGSVQTIPNGINLTGFDSAATSNRADGGKPPVIGYFARMCPEKGLDLLVDAYIDLRKRGKPARLKIGGNCAPHDEPFANSMRERLGKEGFSSDVEFHPNLDRAGKIAFLGSLDIFSVPARSKEAFGLYVIEAMAAGAPVVQPRLGAFPEIVQASGGGLLYDPGKPGALADSLEELLIQPERRKALGIAAKEAVFQKFNSQAMADRTIEICEQAVRKFKEFNHR